jgi:pimeloyl-ACP methyl ester carboxylesterase
MKSKVIALNGANIHLDIHGNPTDRALVFLHGNSLSRAVFTKQAEQLDLPLIMIDLPGHGNSQPATDPEGTYSIPGYARAIGSVIDQLPIDNIVLAGHSLGGHIAISVAASSKKIKGLVLFGTPPLDSIQALGQAFLPNPLFPFLLQGRLADDEAGQLAGSMLLAQTHAASLKKDILSTDPAARSCFGSYVGKGVIDDEVKALRALAYPVAVLHGEHDSFINKAYLDGIGLTNLWNNKVHVIERSGHCPQVEQPERFNSLLANYYAAVMN